MRSDTERADSIMRPISETVRAAIDGRKRGGRWTFDGGRHFLVVSRAGASFPWRIEDADGLTVTRDVATSRRIAAEDCAMARFLHCTVGVED